MAGYLDQYAAGEERRARMVRWILSAALTLLVLAVIGGILRFRFYNSRAETQVRQFLQLLARRDYQGAYALWGCTQANPCRDYAFGEFLKDWGPQSGRGDPARFRVVASKSCGPDVPRREEFFGFFFNAFVCAFKSCGTGVIVTADTGNHREEKLWVERGSLILGFAPWPACPAAR